MPLLDPACLALLDLCEDNPAPSIEEVFEFAPVYRLRPDELHPRLITLLCRGLVAPTNYLDRESFLPAGFVITPAGQQVLRDRTDEVPQPVVWGVSSLVSDKKRDRDSVLATLPRLGELPSGVVANLAEAYFRAARAADRTSLFNQADLFASAAQGYAHTNDAPGFIAAVRGCLDARERRGQFLELAIQARDLAALYPECERAVLAAALVAIDEPYRDLLGTPAPACDSLDDLTTCIKNIASAAMTLSTEYTLCQLNPNGLIGAVNRVEDLIGEAFELRRESLYGQAVELLCHMIELAESVVSIKPGAAAFEARAGFAGRIDLAKRGAQAVGGHRRLVNLPRSHSKVAFEHVIAAIRRVARAALVPVWGSCRDHTTNENTAAYWVISLVEYPERRIRQELIAEMQHLVPMHKLLAEVETTECVTAARLTDVASLSAQLSSAVQLLSAVREDTNSIRYVLMPHLSEQVVGVLAMAAVNADALTHVCLQVSESHEMLAALDELLSDELPAIREDVEAAIALVKSTDAIEAEKRERFLEALGKIAKLSSAGKIVASVPLIPGFMTYSFDSSLALDWNKWLSKLRDAVSRRRS